MDNNTTSTEIQKETKNKVALEKKSVLILLVVFSLVIAGAWGFALKLQRTVAQNNTKPEIDSTPLIEIERLRNLAASQLDNSRAFFLMGSQSLFDRQKSEHAELLKGIDAFQAKYDILGVASYLRQIRELETKNQDLFAQGMDFREKKTESKIVGQFYQSKMIPLKNEINKAFDEITQLHQANIDRVRREARSAAVGAEVQIPLGMTWFTGLVAFLFLTLAYLVMRLVRKQEFQILQQNRLYSEAKKAVQDRDEVIYAISHDLKDSLELISATAEHIKAKPQGLDLELSGDLVKSTVTTIEGLIQDIRDSKNINSEGLNLRMDQLPIDAVLDNVRSLMQPFAKQHDVRLQIDSVNPPVLAFYDNDRVLRVLSNLINNAIKFSPQGEKVVVKVRSDQKFVNISVIDSGPGIPAKQLDGIFDNFWQAKKKADQGPGLGLAIVKMIVEAHGGTVEIQSIVGQGTTVTFSLPRRRPVGASLKKSTVTVRHTAPPALLV